MNHRKSHNCIGHQCCAIFALVLQSARGQLGALRLADHIEALQTLLPPGLCTSLAGMQRTVERPYPYKPPVVEYRGFFFGCNSSIRRRASLADYLSVESGTSQA